ncbi:MAG: hypothetical protein V1887_01805 [Candidatus Aenigmatarchaeota archaeon]
MPLFRVYKPVFETLEAGSKTIEVRTRLLHGENAVFQCGRRILRKSIGSVVPFDLGDEFFQNNWRKISPQSKDVAEAEKFILSIFPDSTHFYAYLLK